MQHVDSSEIVTEKSSEDQLLERIAGVLGWLLSSWRVRVIPKFLKMRISNFLLSVNMARHFKEMVKKDEESSLFNLIIPTGEDLIQGGIWVVEFFPPSFTSHLYKAMKDNGWNKTSDFGGSKASSVDRIISAREGRGYLWTELTVVLPPKSRRFAASPNYEKLPEEFSTVGVSAVQLGPSLTAIVAHFSLSKSGATSLGAVWKSKHEPRLTWKRLRPSIEDQKQTGIASIRNERLRLHELARTWMTSHCKGYFSGTDAGHPVIDLLASVRFDPTEDRSSHDNGEPIRSLGLYDDFHHIYTSNNIPGAVLFPSGGDLEDSRLANSWAVLGQFEKIESSINRSSYGERPYSVGMIADIHNESIRDFLLRTATHQYINSLRKYYARGRDMALVKHGRFGARKLKRLRLEILSAGFDLPAIARDVELMQGENWRRWFEVEVTAEVAPWAAHHRDHCTEYDLLEEFKKMASDGIAKLREEDSVHREVLTTAASLGATAETSKLSRRAVLIAIASLAVAFITLLLADTSAETIWSKLVKLMS